MPFDMPFDDLHVLIAEVVADRGHVVAARRAAARLAAGAGDATAAARVEEGLNDAFLRLQLALVAGQAARVRAERLAIARLAAPALLGDRQDRAPRRTARPVPVPAPIPAKALRPLGAEVPATARAARGSAAPAA